MNRNIISILLTLALIVSCTQKDIYEESFDIQFKTAKVLSFSPSSAYIEDTIQLFGENLDDPTLKVFIGADSMQQVQGSKTTNSVKVIVPRGAEKGKIKVYSYFSADARVNTFTNAVFTPLYPPTEISYIPDTLFATQPFTIQGKNLDLITKVAIGDTIIPVTGLGLNKATFNFKNVKFTKSYTTINFVTKNKDNFSDKELIVFQDLPKIAILAQFPDTVSKNEPIQLLYNNSEFGKFITNLQFEYTYIDNKGRERTAKLDVAFQVKGNKIYSNVPDTSLNGNVYVLGKYNLSANYKIKVK